MIVIEAGTTGGTFACAESTLKYGTPLFVVHYAMPAESAAGNQDFLNRGATPLRGNPDGVPQLGRVLESIAKSRRAIAPRNAERSLFGANAVDSASSR
jgi:predicted Rossmann fold nucleotide-binding protein DprA/Smf involved in DNA uptake